MRISIVTPSFNQAEFLEDTILSVFGQKYPDLEYFVFDGGSTDESPNIIRRYEATLAYWQSEPDDGQAAAINAGFARATGDVLGWLNSDDFYLPGALSTIAECFATEDGPLVVFGNAVHLQPDAHASWGSDVRLAHREHDSEWVNHIVQPSTFWNRAAWDLVGPLDASMHWAFDWDWFIRARRAGVRFVPVEPFLSVYRIHPAHKTGTGGSRRHAEIAALYDRYHGPAAGDTFRSLTAPDKKAARIRRFLVRSRLHRVVEPERVLWRVFGRGLPYRSFHGLAQMAGLT